MSWNFKFAALTRAAALASLAGQFVPDPVKSEIEQAIRATAAPPGNTVIIVTSNGHLGDPASPSLSGYQSSTTTVECLPLCPEPEEPQSEMDLEESDDGPEPAPVDES